MTRTRPPRRRGFTLIELLTVIAILGILTALTVAGVSKVRTAQQGEVARNTLTKLQLALDQQWKAVADQCKQDRLGGTPNSTNFRTLVAYCDNDADRAEAMWTYMNIKRSFPQTFAEATTPVTAGGATLAAPRTFASVTSGGAATDQAAALLYLILTEKASKGVAFAAEDATTGAQTDITIGARKFRAFKDSWGTPITYIRFATYPELNGAPYVNAKPGLPSTDPLDPLGKLRNWSNTISQQAALTALNLPAGSPGFAFNGQNKRITVISAGPNKQFEPDPTNGITDDSVGYRLVRQGNKGD